MSRDCPFMKTGTIKIVKLISMNCIFYAIFEGYVPDLHDNMWATFRNCEAHFLNSYKNSYKMDV